MRDLSENVSLRELVCFLFLFFLFSFSFLSSFFCFFSFSFLFVFFLFFSFLFLFFFFSFFIKKTKKKQNISNNHLDDWGGMWIAKLLRTRCGLRFLAVDGNRLGLSSCQGLWEKGKERKREGRKERERKERGGGRERVERKRREERKEKDLRKKISN